LVQRLFYLNVINLKTGEMKNKKSILVYFLLFAGIIIVINLLSSQYFFRLDFTADQRYTLSKATKKIIRAVEKPVIITAYFTKDLPPAIQQTRNEFKDMLVEYSNISKGKVVFEFVSPNEDENIEKEIGQQGIMPQIINVREKDQAVQKKVYLAALLKYGDKKEIIPFIMPGAAMEYSLSSSIKKLTATNKPTIGFIQGQGEPSMYSMQQALQSLEVLYNVENVNLNGSISPEKYKSLVLVAPRDSFREDELQLLDGYLKKGGNLYIAMNRVNGDLNNATGSELTTGLETWLMKKGIHIDNKFLVDASCGNVTVMQQQGTFSFSSQIKFPFLPLINKFTDHPASSGLETVVLQFASPISFNGDTAIKYEPMAFTSDRVGVLPPPLYFDIQKRWNNSDFPFAKLVVAAAFEGPIAGISNSKMVVIGDGDFAINGEGKQARQVNPDNVNLMVNSIDWLSDDTGLIGLRTKAITNRPLDQIDDGKKTFLKYLNFLLPLFLIVTYGFTRNRNNKIKEIKRMQENYLE
jgi:gliding-associated putative ABC transporter substrate-binding component GldG